MKNVYKLAAELSDPRYEWFEDENGYVYRLERNLSFEDYDRVYFDLDKADNSLALLKNILGSDKVTSLVRDGDFYIFGIVCCSSVARNNLNDAMLAVVEVLQRIRNES